MIKIGNAQQIYMHLHIGTTHGLGFILGRSAFLVGTGQPPPAAAPAPAAPAPSLVLAALLFLLWLLALRASPPAATAESEAFDGARRDDSKRRAKAARRREVTILPLPFCAFGRWPLRPFASSSFRNER